MAQPRAPSSKPAKSRLPVIRRPALFTVLGLVLAGAIGFIDWKLGYEFSLAMLYVAPVTLASWKSGRNAGILVSVVSANVMYLGHEAARPPSVHPLYAVWRAVSVLGFLLLVAWLVSARKRDEARRNQIMAELKNFAVEEERNRIAGETHDTLAQAFSGILYQLEAACAMFAEGPEKVAEHVRRARDLARQSLGEVRRTALPLRSPELDPEGLPGAVRNFIEHTAAGTTTAVDFSLLGTSYPLPMGVALGLLRICQEAVVNALRHAQASRIEVRLTYQPTLVDLCVEDNGRGLDLGARAAEAFVGQISLRERAERMGAKIDISREPGKGTRIVVVVPSPQREAERQKP